jgi:hypothetical protein
MSTNKNGIKIYGFQKKAAPRSDYAPQMQNFSYCDGYAGRQERFGWKAAGLRVQVSLDKPQLLVGLAADLGEHIRRPCQIKLVWANGNKTSRSSYRFSRFLPLDRRLGSKIRSVGRETRWR